MSTTPIIEKLLETVMKSEPMERVLGIESTAIVTGRASQYKGITIQEVLKSALEEIYKVGREEALGECLEVGEKLTLRDNHKNSDVTKIVTPYNAALIHYKKSIKKLLE